MFDYYELYRECELCPHKCKVDRFKEKGFCASTTEVKISAVSYYKGEEPCFNVDKGPGAVFFSNCTMKCVYCQNFAFSQLGNGRFISLKELADIFMQINTKANYLELVTPTHYLSSILVALKIAKSNGFNLPIIYNTSGYENPDTLQLLKGIVDIYLTDFRYSNNETSFEYSKVGDYFDIVKRSIIQMYNQVGNLITDSQGRAIKGVVIRYLVLPNRINDYKIILNWLYENLGRYATISIMDQYVPVYKARNISKLNSYVSKEYYELIINYALDKGFENVYIQEHL